MFGNLNIMYSAMIDAYDYSEVMTPGLYEAYIDWGRYMERIQDGRITDSFVKKFEEALNGIVEGYEDAMEILWDVGPCYSVRQLRDISKEIINELKTMIA